MPMTRSFAIAFILTTLSLFGGLFYLQHRVLTERHAATFTYAEAVQQKTIEQKREQLDELVWRINDRLQDESKARYRPIQPFIERARGGEAELIAAAGALAPGSTDGLQQLLRLREQLLTTLSDSATGLLEGYGYQMDLSPEEIEAKSASYRKRIAQIHHLPATDLTESAFTLHRDLIVLDYLNGLEEVLLDVTGVSGGKMISCFFGPEFFPVVSTGFLNPRRGEKVSTRISVGNYATSLDPEDVTIIIEGDSLKPNSAGFIDYNFVVRQRGKADFSFKPRKRGKHSLKMECLVTNPLTGEVRRGESRVSLQVQ